VLVVSGFLGSGKTSLVRHLLADAQTRGERVAVISNEFGALGIDAALLGGARGAIRELEGGCVCCELTDDLVETLESLRREVAPDRIVIETSGVALPYDVQLSLWRPPVSTWLGDDMGLVVVNAEQLAEQRDLGATFEQQLTAADLVVLNQVDRVPAAALPGLEERLREIEPEAPVVRAVLGRIDPALLLPPEPARERAASGLDHVHERFETRVLEVAPGRSGEDLVAWVRELGVLRAKGWVETDEGIRLLQGVGRRVELSHEPPPPGSGRVGRLVVIRRPGG
jgi:cobalamin biosynthesis protein CobW